MALVDTSSTWSGAHLEDVYPHKLAADMDLVVLGCMLDCRVACKDKICHLHDGHTIQDRCLRLMQSKGSPVVADLRSWTEESLTEYCLGVV